MYKESKERQAEWDEFFGMETPRGRRWENPYNLYLPSKVDPDD